MSTCYSFFLIYFCNSTGTLISIFVNNVLLPLSLSAELEFWPALGVVAKLCGLVIHFSHSLGRLFEKLFTLVRDGSAVKMAALSKDLDSIPQPPHSTSHPAITPVPGDPVMSSASASTGIRAYTYAKHSHTGNRKATFF